MTAAGSGTTPDGRSLFAARLAIIAEADDWLDGRVAASYESQPLAQHWARVAKVGEEGGEAIEKLIAWTGQNPRKPQRDEAREELLAELADVAITATLAIQHFTKDADETAARLDARLTFLYERMRAADPEWFERAVTTPPVCERCDGDGYTESWNADQSDVVITLCTDCGPAPGVHDG